MMNVNVCKLIRDEALKQGKFRNYHSQSTKVNHSDSGTATFRKLRKLKVRKALKALLMKL